MLFALCIVNKDGGVIFSKTFSNAIHLTSNEFLRIGSTFHSLYEISQQLFPNNKAGIEHIQTNTVSICSFKSLTGLLIFLSASKNYSQSVLSRFIQRVYLTFSDYVLKNPFYQLDQVVRCQKFEEKVDLLSKQFSA
eukprot:maker-scaffold_6-snap-gene-12.7-mRNA-1 protein AED:0.03 eAED:0.03 QI:17/1/1/1/0/0/2/48/135